MNSLESPSFAPGHHVQETRVKIAAVFGIFFVSLFAVSFPTVSKRSSVLRIPHVAFFIGKHFGTGVILSTAFCHLLQDSFEHLQNPVLKKEYPRVGKNTGLIILSSLLLIFIVEYVSTSYVDFLHADPSAPSSPADSRAPSRAESPIRPDENTPLVIARPKASPHAHSYLAAVLAPPRHCPLSRHDGRLLTICVTTANQELADPFLSEEDPTEVNDAESERHHHHDAPKVGRGRQVVGIIVLELGILLHSLVIGLTLALTTGGDFTSLLTAIVFHQLFEGLSLGIRIASLPSPKTHHRDWFSIALSLLFALTTPGGLAVGMLAFTRSAQSPLSSLPSASFTDKGTELPSTLLVKGVMSAVSAGMLIYAATVEMIAADFVFGNLEDGPGHAHGEGHSHEVEEPEEKDSSKLPGVGRRALALGSLLAGVGSMVLVSLGE
ncbi:Zip-like iron-zinc transporter [Mycena sanguinolenta]|uniref:Zip-like iron-zinc transporter n=1 Tax=Mycena sanguinolenta TaxID=230812 RepID=A0A8H6YMG3_9AGAR|nr:Zip-like iron-zinc transporter [Mycena sanguinolenta]